MMRGTMRAQARRQRGEDPESGVALVMVLGMMLVGAIIMVTLASVTIFNAQNTLETRVEMRARASADAGIDLALANLEGKKYEDLHDICAYDSFVVNNDQVAVSYRFTLADGSSISSPACIDASNVVTALRVESTATTDNNVLTGETVSQTVAAVFNPTLPDALLDKAIFSEGSIDLRNGTELQASGDDDSGNSLEDAHVYSNGGINCQTREIVDGKFIAAHGDVNLQNDCKISSDVWASGSVRQQATGSVIEGNIYAASATNDAVHLQNGGIRVKGSVLTNGSFFMANAARVDGTVFARTGTIGLQNSGGVIGGSAYAEGNIDLAQGRVDRDVYSRSGAISGNSGSSVGGTARAAGTIGDPPSVTGTRMPNNGGVAFSNPPNPAVAFPSAVGYPTEIQPPPREQMPRLSLGLDGYPATVSEEMGKWIAQGWNVVTTTDCTGNAPRNFINNLTWSDPTMVIFQCGAAVKFDGPNLELGNDLAMVSHTGFDLKNDSWFRSTDASQTRSMFMIVPSDAPGVSWVSAGSGQTRPVCSTERNIAINKFGVESVETMFYTPCTLHIQNGTISPTAGQMYAGKVELQNAVEMQMASLPIPSLATTVPNTSDLMDMRLLSRFDVYGS
ncbi:polymer-forming cytoskeletal protein [Demequina aestuarii]|uniref:polymer-forming cytoskeletal protein n=1 Tax=Demequina aestuarii TaxID=327095 RepID=UPI0007852DA6|nr:polymer-forming cytoskeletal protein [Demequina aestuarii]